MKNSGLTTRQQEIADFISTYSFRRGLPPTVREIGAHFGIRSPNGVACHLKALQKKGIVTKAERRSRSVRISRSLRFRVADIDEGLKRIRLFGVVVMTFAGEVS